MISRFKIKIQQDGKEERWADADKVFAHLLQKYNKKEDKFKELIKKREEKFINQVSAHADQYDDELLEDFIEYWTEPNKSETKMKYELERTWSLSRRLKKWSSNRNGFGKKKNNKGYLVS